ncbi:MAG: inositol monophosphatase [Candidatus Margulisbacteria bacterium]|nr:inositol monophosphatase [Candidatus Margulisiibacteriota bacterium]
MSRQKRELEVDKRLKLAIRAAEKAGRMLVDNFDRPIKFIRKKDGSLVTKIDLKAEKIIVGLIKKYFPKDNILAEESPNYTFDSEYRWIIDPLDGTHNFIRGINIFGTSIALQNKKEVVVGVINMPLAGGLYHAQRGKGCYLNGKRIKVSKKKIKDATIVYDSSIEKEKTAMLRVLGAMADKIFNFRMFGSTAAGLTYVAEGKVEAEIEFNDAVWDFAAGLLLVEEAGGMVSDFKGKRWSIDTKKYVASNGKVHKDLLKCLSKK